MARQKENEREAVQNATRSKLLSAAAAHVARDGFDSANINDISTAAGYAKGTIYNYFPSKRALMLALVKDIAARHVAFISETVHQTADPQERLERFFEAGFAFVGENLAESQVLINTLYGHDRELRQIIYEAYLPLFKLLSVEVINPGIEAGQFRSVEPTKTAGLLMTIYLGTCSQVNEAGRPWLSPQTVSDFAVHALAAGQHTQDG
jgi:AcrR family transcriptional regulator